MMRKAAHADHNTLERSDAGARMRNAIKTEIYVDSILAGALYIFWKRKCDPRQTKLIVTKDRRRAVSEYGRTSRALIIKACNIRAVREYMTTLYIVVLSKNCCIRVNIILKVYQVSSGLLLSDFFSYTHPNFTELVPSFIINPPSPKSIFV